MKEEQILNCKKAYYYTDIEPTLDRLNQVKEIVADFEAQGADRLMSALLMKHMDEKDIERFVEYIGQAREKMEKELGRLHKYENSFNQEFATNHNDYYNSVSTLLRKMRSHMSPLKNILKKFCPTKHPTAAQCATFDLPGKSVYENSLLSKGVCESNIFDLSTFPAVAQGLYQELKLFFKAEEECMEVCTGILEEEKAIRNNPSRSWASLDKYRRGAYERMAYQIILFNEDVLQNLKSITPSYCKRAEYATEEGFAQGEFHKHNRADMDHYFLIEALMGKNDITSKEIMLWGNNPKIVKKIRYVITHFDELLPADFKQKQMGMYEFYFCQWALHTNVKKAVEYFIDNYNGNHKVVKYAAVNKQGAKYDKNSECAKRFFSNINVLFADSKDADFMEFTA